MGAGGAPLRRAQGFGALPAGWDPSAALCGSRGTGTPPRVSGCCPEPGRLVGPPSPTPGSCPPQAHGGPPGPAAAAPAPPRMPPHQAEAEAAAEAAARSQVGDTGREQLRHSWRGGGLPQRAEGSREGGTPPENSPGPLPGRGGRERGVLRGRALSTAVPRPAGSGRPSAGSPARRRASGPGPASPTRRTAARVSSPSCPAPRCWSSASPCTPER